MRGSRVRVTQAAPLICNVFIAIFSEPHRTFAYRASNNVCLFRKLILKHKNRLVAGYKTGLDYDYHSGSNPQSGNSGCAGKNRRACPQVG